MSLLNHGGNLIKAQQQYPDAATPWLDLSTGISPWVWPVPTIPSESWQRLPEQSEPFKNAVAQYYGVKGLVPVAGSQQAIEIIPTLLSPAKVAVPQWGYGEHEKSWRQAGHELIPYNNFEELCQLLEQVEHAVVINPNNPTGNYWTCEQLREIQAKVKGYLLVDEAFVDVLSQPSMLDHLGDGSLIVLRSMGKFFGLAGIRVGFVALPESLREKFKQRLLLWSISAPALYVAERALLDTQWQQQQCERINTIKKSMLTLIRDYFVDEITYEGPLFISVYGQQKKLAANHQQFAKQGIWLRLFQAKEICGNTYLRFGLPENIERCELVFNTLQKERVKTQELKDKKVTAI